MYLGPKRRYSTDRSFNASKQKYTNVLKGPYDHLGRDETSNRGDIT